MIKKHFDQLSVDVQTYLETRFSRYDLDAKNMYDNSGIFSLEFKALPETEMIKFLSMKDVSHIFPKSQYPHLASDPRNVFLEDYSINRARGDLIVTDAEITHAYVDQIVDTLDLDINEDGIIDITNFDFELHQLTSSNEFSELMDSIVFNWESYI